MMKGRVMLFKSIWILLRRNTMMQQKTLLKILTLDMMKGGEILIKTIWILLKQNTMMQQETLLKILANV